MSTTHQPHPAYTPTLPDTVDLKALADAICQQAVRLSNPLYRLLLGDEATTRLGILTEAWCLLTNMEPPEHEHSEEDEGCDYMLTLLTAIHGVSELDHLDAKVEWPTPEV